MSSYPLTLDSFPRAILHIDGDAFFASCEQARNPKLAGKPVVTGKERGIASSMSYEAKARGVTRGMRMFEIRKVCPDAIIMPSDYETYSLLSKRFFNIVRRYAPDVEEYSIDECFADLTGLRRVFRKSYAGIAADIQNDLTSSLGFTFSAGLGPNKVIAKIASKWKKPAGLTSISGRNIHLYIRDLPCEKIWGIGPMTTAYLQKLGVRTALELAQKSEEWVKQHLTKPHYEIWQELRGSLVHGLETKPKENYASIQKVKTFTPPSCDRAFVFSQLSKNIENACIKARRYNLAASKAGFYVRTHDFRTRGAEVKFSRPTASPIEIINLAESVFAEIFDAKNTYRLTGVALFDLEEDKVRQMDLFGSALRAERTTRLYKGIDQLSRKYGKHTVFVGSSFLANAFAQHERERGDSSERKSELFRGETKRRRLNIPMLLSTKGL